MLGKDAHVPDGLADAIVTLPFGKKTAKALRGDIALNVFGVKAAASLGDTGFADIGPKKLNVSLGGLVADSLEKGNRDGIGFFARGASGSPNTQAAFGSAVLHDGRENFGLEDLEHLRITEEAGDVDEHVLVEGLDLRGIALKVFEVLVDFFDFVNHHAAANAANDRGLAVVREIDAGRFAQQIEDQIKTSVFRRG